MPTNDRYQFEELLSALKQADSVLLFSHISPDGDTLGSTLAMKLLLEGMHKRVTVLLDGTVPEDLCFLPDAYTVRLYAPDMPRPEAALALALDVSCEDRLGRCAGIFASAPKTAQIDHHGTNPGYAQVNVIDGDAPATAVLVFRVLEALALPIGRDVAICLYTALATDTGDFVYQSTNAEAFRMMSRLMEAGLPIDVYGRLLFRRKLKPHVALLSRALPSMTFLADDKIAGMRVTLADMAAAGATKAHADGIVDYAIDVAGVRMAYFARETEDGRVKFSLRALAPNRIDEIAARFGGGGHQLAAGCTVALPMDEAVRAVEAALLESLSGGAEA